MRRYWSVFWMLCCWGLTSATSADSPSASVGLDLFSTTYLAPDASEDPMPFIGGTLSLQLSDKHWRSWVGVSTSNFVATRQATVTRYGGGVDLATGFHRNYYGLVGLAINRDRLIFTDPFSGDEEVVADISGLGFRAGGGINFPGNRWQLEAILSYSSAQNDRADNLDSGASHYSASIGFRGPFFRF